MSNSQNFSAEIVGLSELKARFALPKIRKSFEKAAGKEFNNLVATIRREVVNSYNVSDNEVRSVLVGKTTSVQTAGARFSEFGVEFRFKPMPLSKYVTGISEKSLDKPGWAPHLGKAADQLVFIKQPKAKVVTVSVRRGSKNVLDSDAGLGKFGAFKTKSGIATRTEKKTWVLEDRKQDIGSYEEYIEGGRTPIKYLWGPSISQMVSTVWTTPPVQTFIGGINTRIAVELGETL